MTEPPHGPAPSFDPAWNKNFVDRTKALDLEKVRQASPMAMLQTLIDKGADADAICKISDLAEKWLAREAKEVWHRAVAGFKGDIDPIIKKNEVLDKNGKMLYKFAGYDDVKAVTTPKERKWGIVTGFSFEVTSAGNLKGELRVTVGSHTETFTGGVPVPTIAAGGINATQLMGQAQSYLKRYLYLAAFDLLVAGEDSDAVGLIEHVTPGQIGEINDAIEECRKAGNWDEKESFKGLLNVYQIDTLDQLPRGRFIDLMADLDRKSRKGKK